MMTVKPRYGHAINISDDRTVMHRGDSFDLILKPSRDFSQVSPCPKLLNLLFSFSLFSRIYMAGVATGSSAKNGTVILNVCMPRVALKHCITTSGHRCN